MNFAERFAYMISELNFTNRRFSKEIGVTESYISNIKRGKTNNVSKRLADFIESKYGYRSDWILNGTLPIKVEPKKEDLSKELAALIDKMDTDDIQAMILFLNKMDGLKELLVKHNLYQKEKDISLSEVAETPPRYKV